ncbi:putative phospholipid-transporting ATPase IM [Ctenodactylus gundi]
MFCKKKKSLEVERIVKANAREYNEKFQYADNRIHTSKYSVLTFLPANLFEQFQRVANAYFLFLLILQLIPEISSLTWFTTIVPLVLVITMTAVKDATDDYFRHKSDNQVNNRQSEVLMDGNLKNEKWMNVKVGDIIKLENNQFVAADLLLLSSSEPHGLCYVETAELDGETNLKVRHALSVTSELGADISSLAKFDGIVICEAPNNKLDKFMGVLSWKDSKHPLNNHNIILRGCVLRNTSWCFGMVIFAGPDTKLMQNSGKTKFKRTSIDRLMNSLVLWIFGFLVCLGVILAIGNSIWESHVGGQFRTFLFLNKEDKDPVFSGFLTFWSYVIVLNTVVPISLYVSVEVIRLGHSYFINWDRRMYYSHRGAPAEARTTTLNEELGQIEYVFSDKTGTLTQNVMTFRKCSINGRIYALPVGKEVPLATIRDNLRSGPAVPPAGSRAERTARFSDRSLMESVTRDDPGVREFLRLLALCHTVMSEEDGSGRRAGLRSDPGTNAERCRVGVRNPEGQIRLYSKGADTILFEKLHPSNKDLLSLTSDHLSEFAGEGLRTLAIAYRDLDDKYFREWHEMLQAATAATEEREEQISGLYEEIERDLMLLGATAIEDKLQEGVIETIASLLLANIKIWILTGDKQETAVNIGYACNVLTDDMNDVFVVAGNTAAEVREELRKAKEHLFGHSRSFSNGHAVGERQRPLELESVVEEALTGDYALVVNGHSLTVYDQWFIALFNIVYTSLPVLAMGIFDQDVSDQNSMDCPQLYEPGQLNLLFNKRKFFICVAHGIYTSLALFFIPYGAFANVAGEDGQHAADYQSFVVTMATSLVIVVSVQIALDTSYWTVVTHVFIWGSIAMYFSILFTTHSNGIFGMFPKQFPFIDPQVAEGSEKGEAREEPEASHPPVKLQEVWLCLCSPRGLRRAYHIWKKYASESYIPGIRAGEDAL